MVATSARDPAKTAKARQRGPSVTERRKAEQEQAEAAEASKQKKRKSLAAGVGGVLVAVAAAAGSVVYGRQRLHAAHWRRYAHHCCPSRSADSTAQKRF